MRSVALLRFASSLGVLAALLPSSVHADTLDVCSSSCTYSTITDAVAAAVPGDLIDIAAGTWAECYLVVPAGVVVQGAGRAATVVDASTCASAAAFQLGDGVAVTDLQVRAHTASGTGLLFEAGGSAARVDVRDGAFGLSSAGGASDLVSLENLLIAGGATMVSGIEGGDASWQVERATIVQVGGPLGVAASVDSVAGFIVEESIVAGWHDGVIANGEPCTVGRTFFWDLDVAGEAWDSCSEAAGPPNNLDLDPLFVAPVDALTGDFHLQSTAGEWDVSGFVGGAADSPAVDAAGHDSGLEAAEADWSCNLPNLGAYGGTTEASRSWWTECPVTNGTTGVGHTTLTDALAAGSSGDTYELRDGDHDVSATVPIAQAATITSAPGATVELWGGSPAFSVVTADAVLFDSIVIHGSPSVSNGASAADWTFDSVEFHDGGGLYFHSGGSGSVAIEVVDSVFGLEEEPLPTRGVFVDMDRQTGFLTVTGSEFHTIGRAIQLDHRSSSSSYNDDFLATISGTAIWSSDGAGAVKLWADGNGSDLSVIVDSTFISRGGTAGVGLLVLLQKPTATVTVTNVMAVGPPGLGQGVAIQAGSSPEVVVENCTLVGFDHGLELSGSVEATVQNTAFFGSTSNALEWIYGPPGADDTVSYNAFYDVGSPSSATIDSTNLTTCFIGWPTPSFPADPADYLPLPTSCLIDAGNPSLLFNDGPGDPNDIGATGGPGGDDFLVLVDQDGDGFAGDSDCDDTDATVYWGALDACNDAIDSDCSGGDAPDFDGDGYEDENCSTATLPADCDDADADLNPGAVDLSCDTVDQDCSGVDEEDFDGDGYLCSTDDCDDSDADINPGVAEACNGIDDDCDGGLLSDEGDDDGDGWLACGSAEPDCDDDLADTYPGAPEICDGEDNDCDALLPTDEGDGDGDGSWACADCDDADADNFPGNPEVCDGQDNDCSGAAETGGEDEDGDGVALCAPMPDCDDFDPERFPGNAEVCDGADNDCDPATESPLGEADGDGDGLVPCEPWVGDDGDVTGGGDCDDADPANFPGNLEACDGEDNDCDGTPTASEVDGDADGVLVCAGDCDDDAVDTLPDAAELCDGEDNDCDGAVPGDESDADSDGLRPCAGDCDDTAAECGAAGDCDDTDDDGFRVCDGDCDDTVASVSPGTPFEACDGHDSDCDGKLLPEEMDVDADGWLPCEEVEGVEPAGWVLGFGDCDDTASSIHPTADEVCDGRDTDCDGFLITGEEDADGDGFLVCRDEDCDDADASAHAEGQELCDAVDQDCDGDVAEDWPDGDGDGLPDCAESVPETGAPAPGCGMGCSAGGAKGAWLDGLVGPVLWGLIGLCVARRRRLAASSMSSISRMASVGLRTGAAGSVDRSSNTVV